MNPYGPLIRYGIYAAIAGLVVTALVTQRLQVKVARAEASTAIADLERERAAAQLVQENSQLAAWLVHRATERQHAIAPIVAKASKEILDAKAPVPENCRAALRPLRIALDRMRELDAAAAARRARPAAPDVPASSRAPGD